MRILRTLAISIIACFSIFQGIAAYAAAWPEDRPITLVIPFSPGGSTDVVGRLLASNLSTLLKQSVIVDNRAGAGGTMGAAYAAHAKPDGYTLLLATTAHTIAPSVYDSLPYDFIKDFSPITTIASLPHVLIVNSALPIESVADLIKYAGKHTGLNYGSAGIGSTDHLSMELFNRKAGIKMEHVPYKGDGPMMSDLISGHIQVGMPPSGVIIGSLKAHSVKALAVSSAKPSVYFPGVPSINEYLSGYTFKTMYALMVPAGTPEDVQTKLYQAVLVALKSPDMKNMMQTISAEPGGESAKELARFISEQTQEWHNILKSGQ